MKLKAPVHSDKDLVKLPRNHASQTKPIVDLQPAGTEL
jgi:hypothetical protein